MVIIERDIEIGGQHFDIAGLHYITDVYRIQIQLGRFSCGEWITHTVLTNPFPHIHARPDQSDTILLKSQYKCLAVKLGIIPEFYINHISGLEDVIAELSDKYKNYAIMYLKTLLSDPTNPDSYDK